MTDITEIVRQAMLRSGRQIPGEIQAGTTQVSNEEQPDNSQDTNQEENQENTEKLITQCVMEIMQMPCYNIKQLADVRRTLKNVLKALIKESEYVTLGVIKRYVDPRKRALVKSILNRAVDSGLVISTTVDDTVIYQINHIHADLIFAYLERVL